MIVEINTSKLIEEGLTSDQYVLLYLIWEKKSAVASHLLKNNQALVKSLPDLVEKKYLLKFDSSTIIIDRKKVQQLIGLKVDFFWELFNTYPAKVFTGGSNRVLRALSHDSWDAKTCKKKYESKIKTLAKHEHVMDCLNAELNERRKRNSMEYMQQLITWINQSSWEKSEVLLESQTVNKLNGDRYGEGLI